MVGTFGTYDVQGVLNRTMDIYNYIHNVIFIKNISNLHVLTPKDIISLPKAVYVSQNSNVSIVSNL